MMGETASRDNDENNGYEESGRRQATPSSKERSHAAPRRKIQLFKNRETVLNAACITTAVSTLKRAMLTAQVIITLTPTRTRL